MTRARGDPTRGVLEADVLGVERDSRCEFADLGEALLEVLGDRRAGMVSNLGGFDGPEDFCKTTTIVSLTLPKSWQETLHWNLPIRYFPHCVFFSYEYAGLVQVVRIFSLQRQFCASPGPKVQFHSLQDYQR